MEITEFVDFDKENPKIAFRILLLSNGNPTSLSKNHTT
jgi:hypothetical protein